MARCVRGGSGVWSAAVEILFIASAISPYDPRPAAADPCAALAKALRGLGHHVTVLSPLGKIEPSAHSLARRLSTLEARVGETKYVCEIYDGRTSGGVDLQFIGCQALFGKPGSPPPESIDEVLVALVFSQAAAQLASLIEPQPEVVHAHDFQAAASLALLPEAIRARVLSIHDLQAVGELAGKGLPPSLASFASDSGLLGVGLEAARVAVVNGETMAASLQAPDAQGPVARALSGHRGKLTGIPDGLDAASWNPLTDIHLGARFDPADLSGKSVSKGNIQFELELPVRPEVPLVAAVAIGLSAAEREPLLELADALLRNDVQLVIRLGAQDDERGLSALAERFDGKLGLWKSDEDEAMHRMIAGADFLLLPDGRPGKLHLAALRYGTLPIALRQGPVADTTLDCDQRLETGNAFLAEGNDTAGLLSAAQRALAAYSLTQPFDRLRRRAMRVDSSWERSARRYEYLYRNLR
jgi:starch synthase